jgi:protein-L-isoaspartate(D-aspartate) O-methyltransferase
MVAAMLEELELDGGRALDVGTGSGYQAALLAMLADEVVTIERVPELAEQARATLEQTGFGAVDVVVGDGTLGVPERAPFDAIVVAAAAPAVPEALYEQLAPGGRLFAVVGEAPAMGARLVLSFEAGALRSSTLFETVIAPLVNAERPSRFRF